MVGFPLSSRLALLGGSCLLLPTLAACLDHPLKPAEYEQSSNVDETLPLAVNKDVDILFVIDNSGSMGEEQGTLAQNFESFIGVLEEEGVEANYRIGVTTTDNGGYCNGTTPEGGAFRLTSCRGRTSEFVFNGEQMVDATQEACLDVCAHDSIEIQPSTNGHADRETRPRPWLESLDGATNLPDGISTAEAFKCFGPQGINGCGYEQPLESMYKALVRQENDDEDQRGFVRPNAILSVVFVTDEADCSINNDHLTSVFSPDGERLFWSAPDEQAQASSAVCWNAGVECSGAGPLYDECHAQNFGPDGQVVPPEAAATDAVLQPLDRYMALLEKYERDKQKFSPGQEVLVAAISGVGTNGDATYQDSPDAKFQTDYGIGPGCTSTAGEAVPPVRLKEFVEHFQVADEQVMFSVCDNDYSPALEAIADAIRDQIRPACMPTCVADSDPLTPVGQGEGLDPSCVLEQTSVTPDGEHTIPVEPCNDDGSLPDGLDVCYETLKTPEDMSMQCLQAGWNLEFRLVRRDGVAVPPGVQVNATCEVSQHKEIDCPNLP